MAKPSNVRGAMVTAMTWYDMRGGGTDSPMIWVHAGPNTHAMGMHVSQGVWDYVKAHGLGTVAYSRKVMQPQLDTIQAIVDALPKPARVPGDALQAGDVVRVGARKVPWTVQGIARATGIARLSSQSTATQRSELLSNLTRLAQPPARTSADAVSAAVTKSLRTGPAGAIALAVGAALVGVGGAVAMRREITRRRAAGTAAEQPDVSTAPDDIRDAPVENGPLNSA